jgi:YVTN family beta-propeller protein
MAKLDENECRVSLTKGERAELRVKLKKLEADKAKGRRALTQAKAGDGDLVAVIDTATKKTVARIEVGKAPKRVLVVTLPDSRDKSRE